MITILFSMSCGISSMEKSRQGSFSFITILPTELLIDIMLRTAKGKTLKQSLARPFTLALTHKNCLEIWNSKHFQERLAQNLCAQLQFDIKNIKIIDDAALLGASLTTLGLHKRVKELIDLKRKHKNILTRPSKNVYLIPNVLACLAKCDNLHTLEKSILNYSNF